MNLKINQNDMSLVSDYLCRNSDRPIYEVYNEIKAKKLKNRSKVEHIVFTYLALNKRKLGIK